MGMDVYSEHGVLATAEEMLQLVKKSNLKQVKLAIDSFWRGLLDMSKSRRKNGDAERAKEALIYFRTLSDITEKYTASDVKASLESVIKLHGKPAKYGSDDCYVEQAEMLHNLWCCILETCYPQLPELLEVRVFDSARLNGWDVPLGVVTFIFDANACFEQRMTEEGKALKKAIGHCEEVDWTVMNV